jgi:opacity protein-like surface antigen
MGKYKYIILLVIVLVPALGFAQRWKLSRAEYMYGIGISNYLGDLGGANSRDASFFQDIDIANTRYVLSVGYRYRLYQRIAVKGSLSYAKLYGADVNSVNENRDYSFKSNLIELSGHVEYHITEEKQMVSYSSMSLRGKLRKVNAGINFYVFAGIGGAYFKPKSLEGSSYDGRYVGNKNLSLVFPVGLGLKYPISTRAYIGLELGRRFITSDYIDGFSPDPGQKKDAYYFTVISVSYKIKKKSNRRPEYRF